MVDVSLRFAEALDQVRHVAAAAQIWATLKGFAAHFGYTHLVGVDAARIVGGARDAMFYTDAPAVAAAIDRTYDYSKAPFVLRALSSPEPFLISELSNDPRTRGPWVELQAEAVRRGDGLIIPVYEGEEPLAGFNFGGEKPDTSPLARAMLQVLAHAAFARYRTLAEGKGQARPHALTVREIQCLRAAASGQNDMQIGHDLGISSRTVRFHIDGAKGKLKASTRVQAIAKALQERIITI
jgi:DNA-binding CsgD family transcriptional regulator